MLKKIENTRTELLILMCQINVQKQCLDESHVAYLQIQYSGQFTQEIYPGVEVQLLNSR